MSGLSDRGRALLSGPMPEYLKAHFERMPNAWTPENPDGYLGLCVAENARVWDLFEERVCAPRAVPSRRFGYDNMRGCESFRETLAGFLSERLAHRNVAPENVATLAGAGSILEVLGYALGDPGDSILVPTPSYAGFWMDMELRDELRLVPVAGVAENGFRVGPEDYERALTHASSPVRALLLTNPDNPRGTVMSESELRAILEWAESHDLHVILDEVYAFSVFGSRPFVSGLSLKPQLGPSVHVVWAFSKDFAASGLRCGVLVSENEELLAAVDGLAYWSAVSGDTQFLLDRLLRDTGWLDHYLTEMPRRLRASFEQVSATLDALRIPYQAPEAGFFVLADFRAWAHLGPDGLWQHLLNHGNL
ncbi:MAG: aminotransferase class I/II-fold pyridoxal phosphate-dependent enzyme, partial [Myxococcota bacterium]